MVARRLSVVGVPVSAGSHNPGQEGAPAAWREAGLIERLSRDGHDVVDTGDLTVHRYRPGETTEGVRDLQTVVSVVTETADRVAEIAMGGRLPVVLGGDCTITRWGWWPGWPGFRTPGCSMSTEMQTSTSHRRATPGSWTRWG
ncbi:MAG: arginase family protein [Ornithinimicrobium sp.]